MGSHGAGARGARGTLLRAGAKLAEVDSMTDLPKASASTASSAAQPGERAVPGEFRYFDRVDRAWVCAIRRACRRLGFDPLLPDDEAAAFAAAYFDADPLAAAFVDEVYLGQGREAGRALLDQALEGGVGSLPSPPRSLVALLKDFEEDPPWLDWALVEQGAKVFRRYGVDVFRFAGAITLASYLEPSVAKPLILSGGYHGASTRRRFLETAAFWIEVSEPGGLRPGAAGRAAIMRVRVMHVFARRRIEQDPGWQREAWGVPISQADALLTLMGGSVAPGIALHLLGYRTDAGEIHALMHFWRYVGHLMGVRPDWYPEGIGAALRLALLVALKGSGSAQADGARLAQAYVAAFGDRGREARLHRAWTRLFLPGPVRRRYGLTGLPNPAPLLLLAPPRLALETLRRRWRTLDAWIDDRARQRRRQWLNQHLDQPARFETTEPTRL